MPPPTPCWAGVGATAGVRAREAQGLLVSRRAAALRPRRPGGGLAAAAGPAGAVPAAGVPGAAGTRAQRDAATPPPPPPPAERPDVSSDESGSGAVGDDCDPPFLPQTIEFALRQAQTCTAAALAEDRTRLVVALPMGRSRKFWSRLAEMDSEHTLFESSTLAIHFAQLFKGARIRLVLGMDARPSYTIPWMPDIRIIDSCSAATTLGTPPAAEEVREQDLRGSCAGSGDDDNSVEAVSCSNELPPDVLIIGGLASSKRPQLDRLLADVRPEMAVVLFNCMLDVPYAQACFPAEFVPAYICRAGTRCAYMYAGFGPLADGWNVFTETAVFEYEWVGRRDPDWVPTDAAVEEIAHARGSRKRGIDRFWSVASPGCESGFWPFMTISCRDVLPLPGHLFDKKQSNRSAPNRRPFGFF